MHVRGRSLEPREDDVQSVIVEGLRVLGYVVLVTSVRVRRCPHCGRPGAGRYGTTPGVPDVLFAKPGCGNRWYGAEIKSPTGRLRQEQKDLADAGMIFVWRSWEDALKTLKNMPN